MVYNGWCFVTYFVYRPATGLCRPRQCCKSVLRHHTDHHPPKNPVITWSVMMSYYIIGIILLCIQFCRANAFRHNRISVDENSICSSGIIYPLYVAKLLLHFMCNYPHFKAVGSMSKRFFQVNSYIFTEEHKQKIWNQQGINVWTHVC